MAPKQGAAPHATSSRNAPLSAKTTAAATVHSDHRSAVDRAIAKTGQRRINAVLSELQGQRVAQASQASSKAQPWRPLSIKHGDMGIAGGVEGELLNAQARSCDPQQASHAVGWDFAAGTWSLADSTPTSVAQQAASAAAALAPDKQCSQRRWCSSERGSASRVAAQREQAPATPGSSARLATQRQQQTQPSLQAPASAATAWRAAEQPRATVAAVTEQRSQQAAAKEQLTTASWLSATKQQRGCVPSDNRDSVSPTMAWLAPAAVGVEEESESSGEDEEAGTKQPTLSLEDAEAEIRRRNNAELPMSIVEAFLGSAADVAAEDVYLDVVGNVYDWASEEDLELIATMVEPIFFYFPNGLDDRTVWEPRNAKSFVRSWRWLADFRAAVGANALCRHCLCRLPSVRNCFRAALIASSTAIAKGLSSPSSCSFSYLFVFWFRSLLHPPDLFLSQDFVMAMCLILEGLADLAAVQRGGTLECGSPPDRVSGVLHSLPEISFWARADGCKKRCGSALGKHSWQQDVR